ncbi:hypothetical protein DIPPA_21756 [Diplonema papillatum]|nr:hypothetical protein DIPPA_21756 [Diplonema papillatum]
MHATAPPDRCPRGFDRGSAPKVAKQENVVLVPEVAEDEREPVVDRDFLVIELAAGNSMQI